ncbi:MAG: hypothetical protein QOE06_2854 [Thermoleophilaceae bacterium]|jgi:hypothetical protein|nr:hypothetical protein [Thermoleophilaceae bacterium]
MARLRSLSAGEAATLVLLSLWSLAPLAWMLRHAAVTGDTFAGSDGPFAGDQLQYLSWIREAGSEVLAGNEFDLPPSDAVFLHPMHVVSGALWALGLGIQAAYLIWKPVAVLVLFAGFALFVRRTVEGAGARTAALVLALFYFPPFGELIGRTGSGSSTLPPKLAEVVGEVFISGSLWGYLPTAIAVGAMPAYLLAAERALTAEGRSRTRAVAGAALAGLAAAWLHPWQGEVLILVTIGLIAWERFRPPARVLLVPVAATLLPLTYYLGLSELDAAWGVARRQNVEPHLAVWVVAAGLGPLLAMAIFGAFKRPPRDFVDRALILWPLAMLAVYAGLRQVPGHALEGISLPLAVLSVRGWQAVRLPAALGALAAALLVVPGAFFAADDMRNQVRTGMQAHYLRPDEMRAMDALHRDPRPGGVLADPAIAVAVPVHSGRPVWAGHPSWTRDFPHRMRLLNSLFTGGLRGAAAADLARRSGARFALSACRSRVDLGVTAPSVVASVRHFGCATIYELRRQPG